MNISLNVISYSVDDIGTEAVKVHASALPARFYAN